MEELPSSKKISLDSTQDLSALMAMGLPPEVLSTLTSIKQTVEPKVEEVQTKKVVIETQQKDLSHLHGMGLPDEVLNTLRGIKSEDFKIQKAQAQAKEAQLALQRNQMPPELAKLKFNPLTGGFDVPKELLEKTMSQEPKKEQKNDSIVDFDSAFSGFNIPNINNITETPKTVQQEPVHPQIQQNNSSSFSMPSIPLDSLFASLSTTPPESITKPQEANKTTEKNLFDLLNVDENTISTNSSSDSASRVSTTINYNEEEKKEVESALVRSLQISEEGVFLGIILNLTKKDEAIKILNSHCKTQYPTDYSDNIIPYEIEGIVMYVEDELVTQLEFKKGFEGATSRGLQIGDTAEKAIEIYGKPMMKTPKGAVWKNFKVFYDKEIIHSIKIQR